MQLAVHIWDAVVVGYLLIYNSINFILLGISWWQVRFYLKVRPFLPLEAIFVSPSTPSVALIVPAYNESATIVESVRALMRLHYPRYEIIIVNDGSSDSTVRELIDAFGFVRREFGYEEILQTAPVRGFYESSHLEGHTTRMVLIDKMNGGKSDALNAGINAARTPYVCSMDADSLIEPNALLHVIQPVLDNPKEALVCGGQVTLANGSIIRDGKVVEMRLPSHPLALFQVVEYMRSFTAGRTGLAALDSLLVLSGVFAVFNRDFLIEIGGFLSGRVRSRIIEEFCDNGKTVGEDMEVIVRAHRFLIEKKRPGKILFLPYPVTWSQGPESVRDFGKQRARWYRGLAQVLSIHRTMIFNPRYRHIGLFAMPYQFLFELVGPIIETAGYLTLPVFFLMGILSLEAFVLFMIASTLLGMLLSVASVLVGYWTEGKLARMRSDAHALSKLFHYQDSSALPRLLLFAMLSMIGYRQLQLVVQMVGLKQYLKGSDAWGTIARKRF